MKLIKGSAWAKEFFEEGSRPTRAEIIKMLEQHELPGKIIGGRPFIDVNCWMASGVRYTPAPATTGQIPSGASLLL